MKKDKLERRVARRNEKWNRRIFIKGMRRLKIIDDIKNKQGRKRM